MIQVYPLAQTAVDFDLLLKLGAKTIGHKITSPNRKVGDAGSYLEVLSNIRGLENPGPLLKHLFYSFLIVTDYQLINDDLQLTSHRVECDGGLHLLILSGTMDMWQTAVISGCSPLVDSRTRYMLDECLLFFDRCGLQNLWKDYRRVKCPDSTIKLIERD